MTGIGHLGVHSMDKAYKHHGTASYWRAMTGPIIRWMRGGVNWEIQLCWWLAKAV
jgi:hypothetical protein